VEVAAVVVSAAVEAVVVSEAVAVVAVAEVAVVASVVAAAAVPPSKAPRSPSTKCGIEDLGAGFGVGFVSFAADIHVGLVGFEIIAKAIHSSGL
jgi:hypothetical protein